MSYRNCLYNVYQSTRDWVVFSLYFIEQESIEQASSNPVPESHCPAELAQTLIKFNYLWFASDLEDFD